MYYPYLGKNKKGFPSYDLDTQVNYIYLFVFMSILVSLTMMTMTYQTDRGFSNTLLSMLGLIKKRK
jgi:hypothetical protein